MTANSENKKFQKRISYLTFQVLIDDDMDFIEISDEQYYLRITQNQ